MRYALISDIHGNLPALEAVLRDAKEQGAEGYILLGDYFNHLSQTEEVLARLRELPIAAAVLGNEDENTLRLRGQDQSTWTDGQFRTIYWTFRQLSAESFDFLSSLTEESALREDSGALLCFHKSARYFPGTVLDRLFCDTFARRYDDAPISREEFLAEFQLAAENDTVLRDQLASLPFQVFLYGHSHMQYHYRVDGKLLVNPGSCGLHLDGHPGAPYTLLSWEGGEWLVRERRVEYDRFEAIRIIRRSPLYDEAAIWSEIVSEGLTSTREVTYSFLEYISCYAERIGDGVRPYTKETWAAAYDGWKKERGL